MYYSSLSKKKLELQQQLDIIVSLSIGEAAESRCSSFVVVPKLKGKIRVCLDTARLNQALIRLVHRGPTVDDMFPHLMHPNYLTLIDASSNHHNLKLDKRSSYLTASPCQLGRYRYKQLLFEVATAGNMIQ